MFKKKKLLVKTMTKKTKARAKLRKNLRFRKSNDLEILGISRGPIKKGLLRNKKIPPMMNGLYNKTTKPRLSPYCTAKKSKWNILVKHPKGVRPFDIKPNPLEKTRFFKPIPMTPPTFLRKEKVTDKKLIPWGDADLDGTPNQFDCDPRRVWKDAIPLTAQDIPPIEESEAQILIDETEQFDKDERARKIREFIRKAKGLVNKEELKKLVPSTGVKIQKKRETKIRQAAAGILGAILPPAALPRDVRQTAKRVYEGRISGKKIKGTSGGRGRPTGPSGTYMINNQPTYEHEFKKILTIENRKRKLRGLAPYPSIVKFINTTDEIDPQRLKEMQAQRAVRRYETTATIQEPPQEYIEEQYAQVQPTQKYETVETPSQESIQEGVEEQQYREQQDDNILRAPNIMKGELQTTAGIFQDTPETNILNAPQFMKGGLRNVEGEKQMVTVGERPQSNPYGDEYMEYDPGSGRPLLKRRPREKWATGEAL